jgi:hypothetical protein
MALSKKYYKVLASLLKETRVERGNIDTLELHLISFLKGDNERFSESKFREVSTPKPSEV